jgi:RecJ-like exonuclease
MKKRINFVSVIINKAKMKKQFFKECQACNGTGEELINNTWDQDPTKDESYKCDECNGEGVYFDKDELEDKIYDIEDMIDGMINRIRITSQTLKDLSRGMFYELLSKYKNRLQIQAKALARLEMYCANLKSYR